jgi:predicted ATP-binding protein involved in virulence
MAEVSAIVVASARRVKQPRKPTGLTGLRDVYCLEQRQDVSITNRKTFLKKLTLRNFRRFEEITLDLDEKLTLLVADNGGGKTAMLDGIALALWDFANDVLGYQHYGFGQWDIRQAPSPDGAMVRMFPVTLEAEGTIYDKQGAWRWELEAPGRKTKHLNTQPLTQVVAEINLDLGRYASRRTEVAPVLPVIRYFGTGRLWLPNKLTQGKKKAAQDLTNPVEAYRNCLSSSSSYREFEVWFESVVREAQNEQASKATSPHKPQGKLAAVKEAIERVLNPSGWSNLDWDFLTSAAVAVHGELGRLPVSWLSDGIRNLIALVGDLAYRAVRVNPHFGAEACRKSPGIVMIDEVDMHLHPSWQQRVVGLLQEAFPKIQFILTSHSPQVISTVPRESVRILADNEWRMPAQQTRGVESAEVLAEVMEVSATPDVEQARWVNDYQHMIELNQDETAEGIALREKIVAHFGPQHPVVLDCERLKRWQAFKLRGSSAADG